MRKRFFEIDKEIEKQANYNENETYEEFNYIECERIDMLVDEMGKYITSENIIQEVIDAYDFAAEKHGMQARKSGKPFVIHPLSCAYYLAQWRMSPKTIIAGLLHDVIEDTPVTYNEIEAKFGEEVANLVEAVSKVTYFTIENRQKMKASYLRKLFISTVKDVRVIIVKIADRMHNILTLNFMSPEKQKIIAQETLDIYATIAERIGLRIAKNILEDNSFKYLNPEEYEHVNKLLEDSKDERQEKLKLIIDEIDNLLNYKHFMLNIKVFGRSKGIYSIYRKMNYFGKNFSDINDLLAVRIICNNIDECYSILGLIHQNYIPLTGNFKDYIATPKNNLYQSLHTIVSSKSGVIFEVQIRTKEMDEIAERGVAAHWKYKEGSSYETKEILQNEDKSELFSVILNMDKIQSFAGENLDEDLLENIDAFQEKTNVLLEKEYLKANEEDLINITSSNIKNVLSTPSIYIVCPDSSIVVMPFKSTVIDFAYKIHTEIGNKTIGAKINGVFAPINTILNSGELVEVLTSDDAKPNQKWLKYAKTKLAQKEIKKYLINEEKFNSEEREITKQKQIRKIKKEIDQWILDNNKKWELNSEQEINRKVKVLDYETIDDFLFSVANEGFTIEEAANLVYINKSLADNDLINTFRTRKFISKTGRKDVIINKLVGLDYSFATCCYPIAPEDIKALISSKEGRIVIHGANCRVVNNKRNEKDLVECMWNDKYLNRYSYRCKLYLDGEDTRGILSHVLQLFSSLGSDISYLTCETDDKKYKFFTTIICDIKSITILNQLVKSLSVIPGMNKVKRINDTTSISDDE